MGPFWLVTTLLRLRQSCLRAPLIGDEHRALLVMASFLLQRASECAQGRQRITPGKCLLQRCWLFLSAPVEDVPCGSHVFILRLCWKEHS
jgi:hypothetical protein